MVYTEESLKEKIEELLTDQETEVVEYKEAKNDFHFNDIGKYFSALSNEANLKSKGEAWLLFGITNDREVIGTSYRNKGNLQFLKKEIVNGTNERMTFMEIYEIAFRHERVIAFQIPPATRGIPTLWNGAPWSRENESLAPLPLNKLDEIRDAQRSLKKEAVNESIFAKLKNAVSVFSIGVSWALEHSIDVSDSMKARGYGLRGRTAYSIYEFKKRDRDAILVMLLLGLCVVGNALLGNLTWRYFPSIRGKYFGTYQFLAYITYMALCLVPTVIDKAEEHRWKSLR